MSQGYWSDGWNTLDGSIVIVSILEMIMTALTNGSGVQVTFLRVLRMLRVVRLLRLMRSWKGLYKVVLTVMKALPQMIKALGWSNLSKYFAPPASFWPRIHPLCLMPIALL